MHPQRGTSRRGSVFPLRAGLADDHGDAAGDRSAETSEARGDERPGALWAPIRGVQGGRDAGHNHGVIHIVPLIGADPQPRTIMSDSRRSFTSPSGRAWTASLVELPSYSSAEPAYEVLRFASGDLALDLDEWPSNWTVLTDDALVQLVRQARPPHLGFPSSRTSNQRH